MAELTPLYMDISNVYSGDELGLPYRDILGEGIVGEDALEVTQHAGTPDLSVDVAAGACWVLGDTNEDAQPIYRCRNDAVVNLGITPDPSNPRIAIVVAQVVDETFAGSGRTWSLDVIHGTAASSPSAPAVPDSALLLATIDVSAAATSIVDADITDEREAATVGGGNLTTGDSAAGPVAHGLVTTLPTSPGDQDTCVFVDSLSAPTYQWNLIYVTAASKWFCVGGTPLRAATATSETTTSSSYGNLSGGATGPTLTVPLTGTYRVTLSAEAGVSSGGDIAARMSYKVNATAAADSDGLRGPGDRTATVTVTRPKALTAADVLLANYKTASGTATFSQRALELMPVSVS